MKKQTQKELLIRILDISDQDYESKLFNSAFDYLENVLQYDPHAVKILSESKAFWTWWKNQWIRRNEIFINKHGLGGVDHILDPQSVWILRDLFDEAHDVFILNIYPNRIVIAESFAKMFQNLIDETNNPNPF